MTCDHETQRRVYNRFIALIGGDRVDLQQRTALWAAIRELATGTEGNENDLYRRVLTSVRPGKQTALAPLMPVKRD